MNAIKRSAVIFFSIVVIFLNVSPSRAEDERPLPQPNDVATARKELSSIIDGKEVKYTVVSGLTTLFDENDKEMGSIFSTSYLVDAGSDENRPVAFIFNGGPGSASTCLHIGAFGPKIFPGTGNAGLDIPAPPYLLEDNPDSPLDIADLVFIDPVGTGFSRAVEIAAEDDGSNKSDSKPGVASPHDTEANEPFWSVEGDLKSLAEFVRVWLNENNRWGARVFIIGESYGGFRAAGLPVYLSRVGVTTSGAALVSPVISYKDVFGSIDEFTADIERLPSIAATAHYHKLLAPDLQKLSVESLVEQATRWANGEYLSALMDGNELSGERFTRTARELSRLTSIPEAELKGYKLRLPPEGTIEKLILRERGLNISPYDTRMTGPASYGGYEDPLSTIVDAGYGAALMDFLHKTVGLSTARKYEQVSDTAYQYWKYQSSEPNGYNGEVANTGPLLARQMRQYPFLRVFVAMGRYDLVCSAESVIAALKRLDVPRELVEKNIERHIYEGGHMMYTNPDAAKKLRLDLKNWMRGTF
jgi:carboxypeptidase C (cathepsin A)